jgi:hypothetical protein
MSIISDALKKAQAYRLLGKKPQNPPADLSPKDVPPENALPDDAAIEANPEAAFAEMTAREKVKKTDIHKLSRSISIVLGVFIAIGLIGAAIYIFTAPKKAPPKKVIPKAAAKKVRSAPAPAKIEPAKPAIKTPTIKEKEASKEMSLKGIPTKVTIPDRKIIPSEPAAEEVPIKSEAAVPQYRSQYDYPTDLPSLSGIMYSINYPQAIINGEMFSEGETVQGYTIKKILPNTIKLIRNEREYELKLR